VEDETLSCGTGITASALAYAANFLKSVQQGIVTVASRGGMLKVYYSKTGDRFHNIYLEGGATFVFEGGTQ
jgi:diaminopimelate epimerase